jgi:hypothetical protein
MADTPQVGSPEPGQETSPINGPGSDPNATSGATPKGECKWNGQSYSEGGTV